MDVSHAPTVGEPLLTSYFTEAWVRFSLPASFLILIYVSILT